VVDRPGYVIGETHQERPYIKNKEIKTYLR
jgi:hypothetical protein